MAKTTIIIQIDDETCQVEHVNYGGPLHRVASEPTTNVVCDLDKLKVEETGNPRCIRVGGDLWCP